MRILFLLLDAFCFVAGGLLDWLLADMIPPPPDFDGAYFGEQQIAAETSSPENVL